ncbi:NAD(P)-binding domain protein [Niveomyces insectorum RCEF 264]|uniref:NAD(P)-binding domain protein n=1 Tax=Niveomyces insectorum RCEF 264 TaxID=1081102 RepID=A0A167UUW5_9HYPO|nr:NAD(P)-binding domain protein [Niveomyces insectorum RCEF 264]
MADSKVGIVTGAASGMGRALAEHFAAKGWRLALLDVNDTVGQELATKLGPNTFFVHCDVADYASQAAAFTAVWQRWGRLDALLANAGIVERSSVYILRHRGRPVDDVPPAPDLACTDIDWKGVLYGVQLAIHFMRHNAHRPGGPGGKIVVTASNAGLHPHPTYPEYNGAKAAVVQFVRGAAGVLQSKEHILLNCVCPGIVATDIVPPEMVAAVHADALTPLVTIVRAYASCLDDDGVYGARGGVVLECSGTQISDFEHARLTFKNGVPSARSVVVWEPLFAQIHGEASGLPGAIP